MIRFNNVNGDHYNNGYSNSSSLYYPNGVNNQVPSYDLSGSQINSLQSNSSPLPLPSVNRNLGIDWNSRTALERYVQNHKKDLTYVENRIRGYERKEIYKGKELTESILKHLITDHLKHWSVEELNKHFPKLIEKLKNSKREINLKDFASIYDSAMSVFLKEKKDEYIMSVWENMKKNKVSPDERTYAPVIKACRNLKKIEEIEKLHAEVSKQDNLRSNNYIRAALISAYAENNKMDKVDEFAEKILTEKIEESEEEKTVYRALLQDYKTCRNVKKAKVKELLEKIEQRKMLCRALFQAYKNCGKVENANKINERLKKIEQSDWSKKLRVDSAQFNSTVAPNTKNSNNPDKLIVSREENSERINTLVEDLKNCSDVKEIETTLAVLEKLVTLDVPVYNTAITACYKAQQSWYGIEIYEKKIEQAGLTPNDHTYASIAHCYSAITSKTSEDKDNLKAKVENLLQEIEEKRPELLSNEYILTPLITAFFSSGAEVEKLREKIQSNTIGAIALVTAYGRYGVPMPDPEGLLKVIKERIDNNPADRANLKKLAVALLGVCKKQPKGKEKIQEELEKLLNEFNRELIEEVVPDTGIYSVKLHEHTAILDPSIREGRWPAEVSNFFENFLSTQTPSYVEVDVGKEERADMLTESLQNYIHEKYADKFSYEKIKDSTKVVVRRLPSEDSLTIVDNSQNTEGSVLDFQVNDTTSETSNLSTEDNDKWIGHQYYRPQDNPSNATPRRQSI